RSLRNFCFTYQHVGYRRREEKNRETRRGVSSGPDWGTRLQSSKDGLLRPTPVTIAIRIPRTALLAKGDNATSSTSGVAPTLGASTPMAVKSNEGRGRTGSLSGRARSLLPIRGVSRGSLGPTLHRLVRLILSSEQTNFGILRGLSCE
ncbi:hypothetical protein X777_14604, partial [Ooceraea biroi]